MPGTGMRYQYDRKYNYSFTFTSETTWSLYFRVQWYQRIHGAQEGLLLLLLLLCSHPRVWYHSSSCRCSSIPLPRHVLYDGAAAAIINIYGDTIQKRAVPVVVALIVTIVFLTLYVGLLYALVRLSILGAISS